MPKRRQLAEAVDRQVESMAQARLRDGAGVAAAMRRSVLGAFRAGRSSEIIIAEAASKLANVLTDVMIATHLRARLHVWTMAQAVMKRRRALDRIDTAIGFLQTRLQLTATEITQLRTTYGPTALEVAKGFSDTVNRRIGAEIAQSMAQGEHVKTGVKRLRGAFDSMGVAEQATPAELAKVKPYLLETLYRTNTRLAWSAGQWNADQDPAIDEILWGYGYVTVGDGRVRPSHAAMDGTKLPKHHPFWEENWPPNDWGCRCSVVEIWDTDEHDIVLPEAQEIDGVMVEPEAAEGFRFNPGRLHQDQIAVKARALGASLNGLRGRDRTLHVLALLGGNATQRAICELSGRDKSAVSRHVCALAEAGLVEHDPAEWGVSLTADGRLQAARISGQAP